MPAESPGPTAVSPTFPSSELGKAEANKEDVIPPTNAPRPQELPLAPGLRRNINSVKLIVPSIDEQLLETSLGTRSYRVNCPAEMACPSEDRYLQLDAHSPRPERGGRKLSSLLVEDQEIAPGSHSLAAFVLLQDEVLLETVRFRSVVRSVPSSADSLPDDRTEAGCRLLLPLPTQNGSSAQILRMLAVVDPELLPEKTEASVDASISYRLESHGQHTPGIIATGAFSQGTEAVLADAPPGDFLIEATCRFQEQIIGQAQRLVTLNPELGLQAQ